MSALQCTAFAGYVGFTVGPRNGNNGITKAVAGKNPISHVGKLYNTAASRLAAAIVADVGEITEAQCHLLSEIGAPIDQPQLALVQVRSLDSGLTHDTERRVREIAIREIASIREH